VHVIGSPESETAVAPSGEQGAPGRTPALDGGLVGAGAAEIGGEIDVDVGLVVVVDDRSVVGADGSTSSPLDPATTVDAVCGTWVVGPAAAPPARVVVVRAWSSPPPPSVIAAAATTTTATSATEARTAARAHPGHPHPATGSGERAPPAKWAAPAGGPSGISPVGSSSPGGCHRPSSACHQSGGGRPWCQWLLASIHQLTRVSSIA
jgi:hypothetical protein